MRMVAQTNAVCNPSSHHDTRNLTLCQVTPDQIPNALREIGNWLAFALIRGADGKLKKEPRSVNLRGAAKSNDKRTWCDFGQALRHINGKSGHTLGFALPEDRSMTLIDLDHARHPETGAIAAWALPMLARFAGTYTEISVSGEGFHIWLLGTKPDGRYKRSMPDGGAVEIYSGGPGHGRMVTVSGKRSNDAPVMLTAMQDTLVAFYGELFPPSAKATPRPSQRATAPLPMDDSELLTRARNNPDPTRAARFIALFDRGDISGYKSRSEAVAALANDLAYMCGPNGEDHVDSLLQQSALMDEKLERADIRARAIELAYRGRTAFYVPKNSGAPIPHQIEKESAPSAESDELMKARARIAELEAEVATLRAANCALNARLEWERDVKTVPNKIVGASTRETAALLRRDLERTQANEGDGFNKRPDDDGFWRMDTTATAKRYGVSSSTLSKSITELVKVGAVEVKKWEVETSKGPRPRIAVKLAPKILTPKEWVRPNGEERDIGGDHKTCKKCGGVAMTERRGVATFEREFVETACPDCGATHREYIGDPIEKGKRYFPASEIPHQIEKESAPSAHDEKHRDTTQRGSNHIVRSFELPDVTEPPQRKCIRCRAYDWRYDTNDASWYCGSCMPREEAG